MPGKASLRSSRRRRNMAFGGEEWSQLGRRCPGPRQDAQALRWAGKEAMALGVENLERRQRVACEHLEVCSSRDS